MDPLLILIPVICFLVLSSISSIVGYLYTSAADKAIADKAIADKAIADKAIADKAIADKAAADKAKAATITTTTGGITTSTPGSIVVDYPEGTSIKCKSDDLGIFRYTNRSVRIYPNPSIASSWDPNWNKPTLADCTKITKGNTPMDFNAALFYAGNNGTVSGDVYCDGTWGNGNVNKNMKCITGKNMNTNTEVPCNTTNITNPLGHYGYQCIHKVV